jgi:bifunctional non-homologous end joining protein LigD
MRSNKLKSYRAKRDFTRTGEPRDSGAVLPSKQLRFVIQRHAARRLHYDLRLELNGVFMSWALAREPSLDPTVKRLAVHVEDHPLEYGDFEGIIPQGEYGGGTVQIWDRGYWVPEGGGSPERTLGDGELKFMLIGERLRGRFVLVRMRNDRAIGERENWLLIKHGQEPANTQVRGLLPADRSVASGRTMAEIAADEGPAPVPFMTAARKRSGKPPRAQAQTSERPQGRATGKG